MDEGELDSFLTLEPLALRLGIPMYRVKQLAELGCLPHLSIGRRMYFDFESTRLALVNLAMQNVTLKKEP